MENLNNVVLYDGECGFCNFWVQWLLKFDRYNVLRFASLQSEIGQKFLKKNDLNTINFDTLYFIKNHKIFYHQSSAILEILSSLNIFMKIFLIFKIIPLQIRDKIYQMFSSNRKKLSNANCLIPTLEQRKKFLNI